MKYLKLKAYKDGSVGVIQNDLMFYIDNDAAELIVDFAAAGVSGLRKWVDFVMADGSETSRPILAEFTTADTLTISLDNTITKTGPLKLQPYANDPVSGQRINFEIVKVIVGPTLNVLSDSSFVDETALAAALSGKIDLDGLNSNIDELHFDITPTSSDALLEGQLRWNAAERTLDIGVDGSGVVLQVGQETHYPQIKNIDSVIIEDGMLVQYAGTVGGSGVLLVKRCDTPNLQDAGYILGIATENIPINGNGKITWFGLINGVPTDGALYGEVWTDNTILYNHPTTLGGLTSVRPAAPAKYAQIAAVIRAHATAGILLVRPTFYATLGSLSDVSFGDGEAGDILEYDGTKWVNSPRLSVPRWTDLNFPFTQTRIGSNLKPDFDFTNVGLLFPQNDTSEVVYITVQMPHTWKEGTAINPHIHCIQKANQPVSFVMEYKWYNVGDAEPVSWTVHTMNQYAVPYTSGNLSQIVEGAAMIDGTGKKISSILKIKLYRNDNTYTGDFFADQFDIHYQQDAFGSIQEYIK